MEYDEEGFAIVRIKDIIDYLTTFGLDTTVGLDKDGWMEDELKPTSVRELIANRGLFYFQNYPDGRHLTINN